MPRGQDNAGFLDDVLGELGRDRAAGGPRIFLNLARGNLHSSDALLHAIEKGAIRRAAVDVYPEEPRPGQADWRNPYADEPRVSLHASHWCLHPRGAAPNRCAGCADRACRSPTTGRCGTACIPPRTAIEVDPASSGRAVLAVVHSVVRGTKKAVDDAIYDAGASNLGSSHRDFPNGIAYDVSVLDRPLERAELDRLVERAAEVAGDADAIRSVRQVTLPGARS